MKTVLGTVIGFGCGVGVVAPLMVMDVLNCATRWWWNPLLGAVTGGYIGHKWNKLAK